MQVIRHQELITDQPGGGICQTARKYLWTSSLASQGDRFAVVTVSNTRLGEPYLMWTPGDGCLRPGSDIVILLLGSTESCSTDGQLQRAFRTSRKGSALGAQKPACRCLRQPSAISKRPLIFPTSRPRSSIVVT